MPHLPRLVKMSPGKAIAVVSKISLQILCFRVCEIVEKAVQAFFETNLLR